MEKINSVNCNSYTIIIKSVRKLMALVNYNLDFAQKKNELIIQIIVLITLHYNSQESATKPTV